MYGIALVTVIIAGAWLAYKTAVKRRREKLSASPFNPEWEAILKKNLRIYQNLPSDLKHELHGHINVFLHEKHFEGCGGLVLTDEIKVTIAAQACMLLLNRETSYYSGLTSILVYPSAFIVRNVRKKDGFVADAEVRLGESWRTGMVVLSWDDIIRGVQDPEDGHNVVLHEFAHQLDQEDGVSDGTPVLQQLSGYAAWARVLGREFADLQAKTMHGTETLMDSYGATNPAEFFAVATETFFEKSVQLKRRHPELYEQLKNYYRIDPADWVANRRPYVIQ